MAPKKYRINHVVQTIKILMLSHLKKKILRSTQANAFGITVEFICEIELQIK